MKMNGNFSVLTNASIFILCFGIMTISMYVMTDSALSVFFKENEKNITAAYEMQKLYLIPNSEVREYGFHNFLYVNKNMLHCKVDNVSDNYQLEKTLTKNGWRVYREYYAKNNLVAKINKKDKSITIDIYYK